MVLQKVSLLLGKEEYGTLLALSTRTRAEMAAASKGIQVGEKVIRVNWWVFKTEKLEHFDDEKKEEIQNTGIIFALLYILRWCVFNIKIMSSICDLTYI